MNLISWTTFILAFGIFPSLTALSIQYANYFPDLYKYSGPLNIIKLSLPILLFQLWQLRKDITKLEWRLFATLVSTISLCSFLSSIGCETINTHFRETLILCIGLLAGLIFWKLPKNHQKTIVSFWAVITLTSIFVEFLFPDVIQFLYDFFFDPMTRIADQEEIRTKVVTGIFGRQSIAKLLSWIGFLWAAVYLSQSKNQKFRFQISVILIGFPLLVLLSTLTSQRGPLLALLCGILISVIHQTVKNKNKYALRFLIALFLFIIPFSMVAMPRSLLQSRFENIFGPPSEIITRSGINAENSKQFRKQMNGLSIELIQKHPLGRACVADFQFKSRGISPSHAHNLFLEQFRSRGWLWGFLHLSIWLFALLINANRPDPTSTALLGGITSVIVGGMFDHPWNVLNHALILGCFLAGALHHHLRKA